MFKLLQLNVTANWGSTGRIAEQIGIKAIEQGWDSYIIYGRHMNPSKNKIIKIGNLLTVSEHYLENKLFDNEGLASRFTTLQIINEIKKINPNVIHLHNIHDHWLNYSLLFNYLNTTDIRIIWTFHDCWAFTGHCYHFVQSNCKKWQTECKDCPQRSKYIDASNRNFLLKKRLFTANKNLTIVPVSDWMSNLVKASFLKNKRIEVIKNGVDLNVFQPIENQKNKTSLFKILAVSNVWLSYKGLDDILKLRELLSDEYELTIVGLSLKQIQSLPRGICGIKRTQNIQELVKLYNESDVFINVTYADTFPTVNLEALACGTPVITYHTGGSPEAVDHKTGIVIPQGDVNALAESIRKLKLRPLNSYDCRNRAIHNFDKDQSFAKYIKLYNDILK